MQQLLHLVGFISLLSMMHGTTNIKFIKSVTKHIILITVNLVSSKADIGFKISFLPVSWLKQVNWYISLHDIHNTLSAFITTAPTVCKRKIVLLIYSWLEYRRTSFRMFLNNIALKLLLVSCVLMQYNEVRN